MLTFLQFFIQLCVELFFLSFDKIKHFGKEVHSREISYLKSPSPSLLLSLTLISPLTLPTLQLSTSPVHTPYSRQPLTRQTFCDKT